MASWPEHGIGPIDLVVVNLYPFAATVAKPDCHLPLAIENIDIGGPTMVRSAAKTMLMSALWSAPRDYARVLNDLKEVNGLRYKTAFTWRCVPLNILLPTTA